MDLLPRRQSITLSVLLLVPKLLFPFANQLLHALHSLGCVFDPFLFVLDGSLNLVVVKNWDIVLNSFFLYITIKPVELDRRVRKVSQSNNILKYQLAVGLRNHEITALIVHRARFRVVRELLHGLHLEYSVDVFAQLPFLSKLEQDPITVYIFKSNGRIVEFGHILIKIVVIIVFILIIVDIIVNIVIIFVVVLEIAGDGLLLTDFEPLRSHDCPLFSP
mmetsp:Transcript_8263/g.12905  ORF Transcript_8263/g.12905 Transcript_8263/m.12905 type:complete len:219 (-) Transcript_8263:262-918(-)